MNEQKKARACRACPAMELSITVPDQESSSAPGLLAGNRGGSISRLNLFYFVIQIIIYRDDNSVFCRNSPDCSGEDLDF